MTNEFIIITRPARQAKRFNQQLIDAKIKKNDIILSPISKIINLTINPKITTSTILIFTSENALFSWECDYKEAFNAIIKRPFHVIVWVLKQQKLQKNWV